MQVQNVPEECAFFLNSLDIFLIAVREFRKSSSGRLFINYAKLTIRIFCYLDNLAKGDMWFNLLFEYDRVEKK